MSEAGGMNEEKYYLILILYGIVSLIIIFPTIFLSFLDFIGIYSFPSNLDNFLPALLMILALIGLFLVHPLFFNQVEERLSKVTDFIISGIAFVILGVICLLISILANPNIFLKFFGFPVLGILLIDYGITFFYKGYKK